MFWGRTYSPIVGIIALPDVPLATDANFGIGDPMASVVDPNLQVESYRHWRPSVTKFSGLIFDQISFDQLSFCQMYFDQTSFELTSFSQMSLIRNSY
jgi:hypothetical protein